MPDQEKELSPRQMEEYQLAAEIQSGFVSASGKLKYNVIKQHTITRKGHVQVIFVCDVRIIQPRDALEPSIGDPPCDS